MHGEKKVELHSLHVDITFGVDRDVGGTIQLALPGPIGDRPSSLLGQALADLFLALSHGLPPFANCAAAIKERGPSIKALSYIGISVMLRPYDNVETASNWSEP